jgi:hypothetical protein
MLLQLQSGLSFHFYRLISHYLQRSLQPVVGNNNFVSSRPWAPLFTQKFLRNFWDAGEEACEIVGVGNVDRIGVEKLLLSCGPVVEDNFRQHPLSRKLVAPRIVLLVKQFALGALTFFGFFKDGIHSLETLPKFVPIRVGIVQFWLIGFVGPHFSTVKTLSWKLRVKMKA